MSSMQRYLSGPERTLFETNVFELDRLSDREPRRFDFDPRYESQAPWPYPEKDLRQRSPDNYCSSWSVSSASSYNCSYQDEPNANRFGSPEGVSSPPHSEYRHFPTYSLEEATLGAGGSCTLQDIQQYPSPAEDTDLPGEYDDCTDIKVGYACEQETVLFHGKMEPDNQHSCAHLQEEDTIRVREAESVKPALKKEDDADSDWKPRNKRRRRVSQSSSISRGSTHRSSKLSRTSYTSSGRVTKRPKCSSSPKEINPTNRPFPCPFAGYSCQATFASKNEWKRHVSTQHIRLGFWRCQLCPSTTDGGATTSYNDFNRKDLFAQHLRRMHMASQSGPKSSVRSPPPTKDAPITEDNMQDFQKKCYMRLRDPPPRSSCLFCNRSFEGPGSWDERIEHVGRHLEKDKKNADAKMYGIERWRDDHSLESWLTREGLVAQTPGGEWQLGNGKPRGPGEINVRRAVDDESDVLSDDG
ncbi:hypothetical protein B0J12DRAFT_736935 [Macrophomina phaseolina]|uniref:C2H2-type domain-containing protein n=1 Tax=Macrophomina phaseolina TaxID=35725 RepID=A0ABQ8GLV5_9PEZI|nr:hypothetical protein B0J12DRAFT_736935 [Macrophomina phaseolina]